MRLFSREQSLFLRYCCVNVRIKWAKLVQLFGRILRIVKNFGKEQISVHILSSSCCPNGLTSQESHCFSDTASHMFAQIIIQKLPTEFQHLHTILLRLICENRV